MTFKNSRIARSALWASVSLASLATPAFAQSAEDESTGIADIVVTAQKREENVQDTPISIVAMGAEMLEEKGVNSLNDLFNGAVPSVRVAPFVGRVSAVTIGMRGLVPVDATQVTRDPTVGIYIDSVYLGRVSGLGMEMADIERIEVLRGPQGTLFGRNTIGGAISIVSKKPTGEFGLDIKAGAGNYGSRSFVTHVNLPELAGFSMKVDALVENRDGLVRNTFPGSRDFAEIRKSAFKWTTLWRPTDNFSVVYALDSSREKPTSNYQYITASDQPLANRPTFVTIESGRTRTTRIGVPMLRSPQKALGHSLTAEWEVSDTLLLRSITAFRKLDSVQWDQDITGLTTWGVNRRIGRMSFAEVNQKQFSQELQFVGDVGDFKYVFGGYYFRERGRDQATVFSAGTLNATRSGIDFFPAPTPDGGAARVPDRAARARISSKALFGQVTWSPSSLAGLHVTAGARYTDDHKDGLLTAIAGVNPNLKFVFDSSRVDPMATIAFDLSDDITTYVKWSRAYRAGGANTRSATLSPFGEEELTAWEGGIKADLFDKHLRVNLAAYSSRLSNQQVDFINPAFISNTETVNAPEKRRLKGVEADITIAPFRGLMLGANYVYTDAPPTPVRNFFTGVIEQARSAFTPKHAATFSIDYTFPAFSFGKLKAHLDFDTAGNYIPNGTVNFKSESALLMNGRLTLADIPVADGRLEFALWGKNLTNATYDMFNFRVQGRNTLTVYNDPRTYGIEARIRF